MATRPMKFWYEAKFYGLNFMENNENALFSYLPEKLPNNSR